MKLADLKLSVKIVGSFVVVLLFLVVLSLIARNGLMSVADRVEKADDANRLVKMILEIRKEEKNYIITGDQAYIQKVDDGLQQVLEQSKKTKDKFQDTVNKNQMDTVMAKVTAYGKAFHDFEKLNIQKYNIMETMRKHARLALEEVQILRKDQNSQLASENMESLVSIKDKLKKVDDTNRILEWFLDARKNEKEFIISNGEIRWKNNVDHRIKNILDLSNKLKAGFTREQNIKQIERVISKVRTYKKNFAVFAGLTSKQAEYVQMMLDTAHDGIQVVQDARKDQKIKMQDQIKNSVKNIVILSVAAIIIGLVLGVLIVRFVIKGIIKPIHKGIELAQNMAQGDLTRTLNLNQTDEIGLLGNALDKMVINLKSMVGEIALGTQTLTASSTELSTVSEQISSNSMNTAEKSARVAAASEEMATNIESVSASTEQTSANIQAIVAAIEEMTVSINEISNNTSNANEITSNAVNQAQDVSQKVDQLGKASLEINKITETIVDISAQTNLLALNATIEAARAGEAGKGFAVVAQEIKSLALQTDDATREIKDKISAVHGITSESITSIASIVKVINNINEVVSVVAAAIEEQSSTTNEISSNVTQIAGGVQEISENISQASSAVAEVTQDITLVSNATNELNSGSENIKISATELSQLAEKLNGMVKRFRY